MIKRRSKTRPARTSSGVERLFPSGIEFYERNSSEKSLLDGDGSSDSKLVTKTGRHRAVPGHKREEIDPRETRAFMAILRIAFIIFLIAISFFMLWKAIKVYEESIWLDHGIKDELSPVLQEVVMVEEFDIREKDSPEEFIERIESWHEADRLVRSADALIQRSYYDQAIERCQDALRLDPAHMGALKRLGKLYHEKENYVEAINAYIRLLSIDPSKAENQKRLIGSLDAFGDSAAVMYMTEWYLDQNTYDIDVQRYLANAWHKIEEFPKAALACARVLRDAPEDVQTLELQASSYMMLSEYEEALLPLSKLREINYRKQAYYKQIAVCNAQLQESKETVSTLARSTQLFGEKLIISWVKDPQFDPVREDYGFRVFIEQVLQRAWDVEKGRKGQLRIDMDFQFLDNQDASDLMTPRR